MLSRVLSLASVLGVALFFSFFSTQTAEAQRFRSTIPYRNAPPFPAPRPIAQLMVGNMGMMGMMGMGGKFGMMGMSGVGGL